MLFTPSTSDEVHMTEKKRGGAFDNFANQFDNSGHSRAWITSDKLCGAIQCCILVFFLHLK